MKILPFVLTAAILAGTARAEPAPAPSATQTEVVVTDDELDALTDYRKKHVLLTADELAFLTEYRKTQSAAQVEESKPKTGSAKVWEFVGNWWFLILIALGAAVSWLCQLYQKWQDWRLDRRIARRVAAEEAEEAAALAAEEAAQREDENANR